MSHQQFIGFGTLEDWRAAIDPARPVNAESISSPGKAGRFGISYVRQSVVLSQIDSSGHVLYVQLLTGGHESMDGANAAFEGGRHHRRALSAWAIVNAWLSEQGLGARRALIAMPRSLKLLDGHSALMRYDKATDTWVRVVEAAAAALA
jgi:hypothetical protein